MSRDGNFAQASSARTHLLPADPNDNIEHISTVQCSVGLKVFTVFFSQKERKLKVAHERNRLMILFLALFLFLRLYGSRHKSILGFVNIHSCINPSGKLGIFIASKHGIMTFSFFHSEKENEDLLRTRP